MLEGFMTWQALAAFILGVLLAAMVKNVVASARSKVSGG